MNHARNELSIQQLGKCHRQNCAMMLLAGGALEVEGSLLTSPTDLYYVSLPCSIVIGWKNTAGLALPNPYIIASY